MPAPRRPRSRRWLAAPLAAGAAASLLAAPLSATVEEQRARLPPPARCDDPVEGAWVSLKFDPRFGQWENFTLEIRRTAPGAPELTGVIRNHVWDGDGTNATPLPCGPGDHRIKQPAKGRYEDGKVDFGGSSWANDEAGCKPYQGGYNPDRFSGTIDPSIQEFQSVNNDGGRAVNNPFVFRRVRCFDPESAPPSASVSVKPPTFEPPRRLFGCSH